MQPAKEQESRVINQEEIYRGKWLGMKYVNFSIGERTVKQYQAIFRTTSIKGQIDGVDIIPIIKYQNKPSQLVMIVQFRPPVKGFSLEFPTGMAESQNYQQNAKRQLLQQTGYICKQIIKTPMPVIYCDPWKSNQSSYCYMAVIDGDDENCKSEQKLESTQNIRVVRMRIDQKLMERVVGYCKKKDLHLEGKIYALCMGLWLRHNLTSLKK